MKMTLAIMLCLMTLACVKGDDNRSNSNAVNSQQNRQEDRAEGGRRQERRARREVEEHLASTDPQLKNIKIELFHTSPQYPDKAYIAVSGTRQSAGGNSNSQPETKAFILMKEGDDWNIATGEQPPYTTSVEEAERILAGTK